MIEIELPDGTVLEAPDGADPSAIAKAYLSKPQPAPPSITTPQQAVADTAASLASGAVAAPVAGLAGFVSAPFVGMDRAADITRSIQDRFTYSPRTQAGQAIAETAAIPFELLARGADFVGQKAADATGSPAVGAAVNTATQSVPALLARGRVGNGRSGTNRPSPSVATRAPEAPGATPAPQGGWAPRLERVSDSPASVVPSLETLKQQKNAAYTKADNTGVVISRGALNRLKVELVNDLRKEGLDPDLHPKANAALKRIINTKGQVKLSDMETLRRIANDAKGSMDKGDSRFGARIVEKIDDFEETLGDTDVVSGSADAATAYKEARALNTRVSKAETIGELFRRAELNAPNFSGSGMENALRTEFRALAKNKREMRRFSPEERAAIEKVAKGGPLENAMRYVGKFAPTGVVSATLSGGVGAALLGPAGVGVPLVGIAGRTAATRMTARNAAAAEELMRAGSTKNAMAPERKRNALVP